MHYDQSLPSHSPTSTTEAGFPKFRRLPPEIRNMIWEFALPEGRVYEVLDAPGATYKTPAAEGLMFANVHAEPPPALAAVCRESRSFVLHHYRPLTLGRTTKFVDLSRDMLLLEPYLLVKRLHRVLRFLGQIPLVRDQATRLALGTSYGVYTGIFHPVLGKKVAKDNMAKLLAGLAKFRRLHTLVFVVHQEFQFEFDFRFPGTLTPMPSYGSAGTAAMSGMMGGYLTPPSSSSGQSPLTTTSSTPSSIPSHSTPWPHPLAQPHAILQPMSLPPPTSRQQPSSSPPPPPPQQQQQQDQPSHPRPPSSQQQPQQQQQQQQVHQAYRFKFDIESNINTPPRRPHTNELLYYPLEEAPPRELDEFDAYEAYVRGGSSSSSSSTHPSNVHGSSSSWVRRGECVGTGVGGGGGGHGRGNGGFFYEAKRWDYCFAAAAAAAAAAATGEEEEEDGEDSEWRDPWPTNEDWRRFRRRWVRAMVAACLPPQAAASGGGWEREEENVGWTAERGSVVGRGCATATKGVGAGKGTAKGRMTLPKWRIKGASLLWRYTKGVGRGQ
ncbi:hypothetical protein VTJ49DRAFT_4077 [Mycothermus thermophilus]|uniref:2EXR domain-containing protein n=1 Tax=Humicola insolens TaxID=85995 RepID=A0ABR3V677_HUMIN